MAPASPGRFAGLADSTRSFCSEASREAGEPLAATASRVDAWILVEYRGLWASDALAGSGLSEEVKAHLREQAAALRPCKLLFVRRPERRRARGLAAFVARSPERGGKVARLDLDGYPDLLGLELAAGGVGTPLPHPLLLVCTHGKHDPCCARHGRPLYEALRDQADEDWVWQCTHVGGDRFAGNLVVLPDGVYYGRVEPGEALPLLEEHLAGRLVLDRYRGRSCYPFAVQAAERALREERGLLGLHDLALLEARSEGERLVTRFRLAGGEEVEVEVRERPGERAHLTCAAQRLGRPRRFSARTSGGDPPGRAA